MITICKCQYCGRGFEAKRSHASVCPNRECQLARMRDYHYVRTGTNPRVIWYRIMCCVCGTVFKARSPRSRYCSNHCRRTDMGVYKPKLTVGYAEDDRRIGKRRREVYARMQQFAHLDGYRK